MKILSHRGYWLTPEEKNSFTAFARSFDLGFGVETDIRDSNGEIVIAHDMPNGSERTLEDFLKLLDGRHLPLALNIKADGLSNKIKELLNRYDHSNYFTFDTSIPESRRYLTESVPNFCGLSEFIPSIENLHEYQGVWLDLFKSEWYSPEYLKNLLSKTNVCLVSPELHGRPQQAFWAMLKKHNLHKDCNLSMCTDFPRDAELFFLKETR